MVKRLTKTNEEEFWADWDARQRVIDWLLGGIAGVTICLFVLVLVLNVQ